MILKIHIVAEFAVIGRNYLKNVIELFCTENLAEDEEAA